MSRGFSSAGVKPGVAQRHATHRVARVERPRAKPLGRVDRLSRDRGWVLHGALAQLGEHLLCKQGVIGSIPISSTIQACTLGL